MVLLEHNQKVYDEAVEYFKNGGKDLLIVQDTGTGKSFICAELLNTIFKGMSVLYVVPVFKIAENFKNSTGCSDNIEFVSYRFFKDDVDLSDIDVIVFDEAHHTGSNKCGNVIQNIIQNNQDKYIIGLTATPVREDKVDVSTFFSKTINGASVFECIENGLMPKFAYISCSDHTIKDINSHVRSYGVNSITRDGITYNLKIDYNNSIDLLKSIVKDTNLDKWICFFGSVKELNENEEAMKSIFQGYTIVKVHSYLETVDLEGLSTQSKVVVLSVNMFLEGIHLKGVQGILISRNVGSVLVFRQILGRVSSIGSNVSPVVIDCTNVLFRIVEKLMRSERESKGIQIEKSEYVFKEIINTTLVDKKYVDISNLLQNLYDIGKYKTICGYTFKSDRDLSVQLDRNPLYVRKLRKMGLSYEEIIKRGSTSYKYKKRGEVWNPTYPRKTVLGYSFISDKDLSIQLGKSSSHVANKRIRRGLSYEEIIREALAKTVLGYTFINNTDLSRQLNKCDTYVSYHRLKGLSYEEIIERVINNSKCVSGYTFINDSDLSRQLNKSVNYVAFYRREGLSYEEIIKRATKVNTVLGYTFTSDQDLSRQLNRGVNYVGNYKRKGLSYEEIIKRATKE